MALILTRGTRSVWLSAFCLFLVCWSTLDNVVHAPDPVPPASGPSAPTVTLVRPVDDRKTRTTACGHASCKVLCYPNDCRRERLIPDEFKMDEEAKQRPERKGMRVGRALVDLEIECHGPNACTGLIELNAAKKGGVSRPSLVRSASLSCVESKVACMGTHFSFSPGIAPLDSANWKADYYEDFMRAKLDKKEYNQVFIHGDLRETIVLVQYASDVFISTVDSDLRRSQFPFDQFIMNRFLFLEPVLTVTLRASPFSMMANVFDLENVEMYATIECQFDHACIANLYWLPDKFYINCEHKDACDFSTFFVNPCNVAAMTAEKCRAGRVLTLRVKNASPVFIVCDYGEAVTPAAKEQRCLTIVGFNGHVVWVRTVQEWKEKSQGLLGKLAKNKGFLKAVKENAVNKAWLMVNAPYFAGAYLQAAMYNLATAGVDAILTFLKVVKTTSKLFGAAGAMFLGGFALPLLVIPSLILAGKALYDLNQAHTELRHIQGLADKFGKVRSVTSHVSAQYSVMSATGDSRGGEDADAEAGADAAQYALAMREHRRDGHFVRMYDFYTGEVYDFPTHEYFSEYWNGDGDGNVRGENEQREVSAAVDLDLSMDMDMDMHVDVNDVRVRANGMPVIVNYDNIQLNVAQFVMALLLCFCFGAVFILIALCVIKQVIRRCLRPRRQRRYEHNHK